MKIKLSDSQDARIKELQDGRARLDFALETYVGAIVDGHVGSGHYEVKAIRNGTLTVTRA